MIRIGQGLDVHVLKKGLPLRLGGVLLPSDKGAVAHSDGDCLIHALCDALLGAAALGDIGRHFPDTDAAYKNIDSKILLARTAELLHTAGYRLINADCTLCLQWPKVAPHIDAMRHAIASVLRVEDKVISIKATTAEGLGFVGRRKGMAALAVVLVESL